MLKYLGTYLAIFLTMFVIDMVWLGVIAKSTYANAMGPWLSPNPNLWAAAAFYLMFPAGLLIFAVLPQASSAVFKAAVMGALFGFFALHAGRNGCHSSDHNGGRRGRSSIGRRVLCRERADRAHTDQLRIACQKPPSLFLLRSILSCPASHSGRSATVL